MCEKDAARPPVLSPLPGCHGAVAERCRPHIERPVGLKAKGSINAAPRMLSYTDLMMGAGLFQGGERFGHCRDAKPPRSGSRLEARGSRVSAINF